MVGYSLIPVWCFVDMLEVSEVAIMNAIRQGKLLSVIDLNNNHLISAEDFYKVFPDVPTFEDEYRDPYEGYEHTENSPKLALSTQRLKRRLQVLQAIRETINKKHSIDDLDG